MRIAIPAALFVAGNLLGASPFSMNGWQFHSRDVPRVSEAIRKAPEYGVTFFIFSHGLFDHVDPFLADPSRQKDVQTLGALADSEHIPWYLWLHEFDDIPDRFRVGARGAADEQIEQSVTGAGSSASFRLGHRVNIDDPALMEYLRNRYERLLTMCPTTAGLVLTLHESDNKLFRNSEVQSSLPVDQRIYVISKLIYDVCKKHNKKLILRNFFYEPKEMEYFAQAVPKLPDDIIIMSKDVVHDFDPWYPFDPLHGRVGKKMQIMETDLSVEKAWSREGLYAQPQYIKKVVERARDTGLAGVVGRVQLFWDHSFADTHEVNFYAFSRFMKDPTLSVDTVMQDWVRRKGYSADAANDVVSALKRTEFIQHHGRWFLEFWLTKVIGAEWGDYPYYYGHILLRSRYKWTHEPPDKKLEDGLYDPDQALFDRLVSEKDEVIAQVRAGMADIERAAAHMSAQQGAPYQEGFRYLLDAAECQKEWTRAYFAETMWMKHPSAQTEGIVRDALAKLETLDKKPGVTYGLNRTTGHRYNIDRFALEMRWRLANRARALAEDARILEDTRRFMDVDRN
ncbi:MAG TPA: hypothetical protein VKB88_14540 [Bryobacteraceae bacterium]|nr:hypothetical protein [Bryobacteraceae bacterium]